MRATARSLHTYTHRGAVRGGGGWWGACQWAGCGAFFFFRFSEDALGEPRWWVAILGGTRCGRMYCIACMFWKVDYVECVVWRAVHLGSHFAWRMGLGSEASLRDEMDGCTVCVCTHYLPEWGCPEQGLEFTSAVRLRRERSALLRILARLFS